MIPATLVVMGAAPLLDPAVARAAVWLPFVPDAQARPTVHRTSARGAGAAGDAAAEVRVVQWQATGPDAPRRPASLAVSRSGAWLACSGSWLPAQVSQPPAAALPSALPAALNRDVAALLALAERDALWPLPSALFGQGTLVWQTADGVVQASCDSHGGGLLYYGARDGVVAVGNRATLVAAALNPDGAPELAPAELLWPLSRMGAPVGVETAYRGVHLLPQGGRLRLNAGHITVDDAPAVQGVMHDIDSLTARLLRRPLALDALPDHAVEVMISGGKDVRLVLAALRAAGRLDRVTRAIIWAPQDDPDLIVARQLAAQLGLAVEVRPSPVSAGPWQEGFLRHAFLGEGMVHAWDRKGAPHVRDVITLNGYFGELYKSHVRRSFALGPLAWRHFYGRRAWFDRHALLTKTARAHLRDRFDTWLAARTPERHPWHLLNDRWHREARMQRWVGHILQAEASVTPWLQLLPDAALLERYVGGPLRDRTQHRLHFELLRRLAPDLLALPLAEDRWSARLDARWTPPPAQRRQGDAPGAPAVLWARHGPEMAAWLRDGARDGMMTWVDKNALNSLLDRCLAAPPSRPDLIGLMALLGVRAAFSRPTPLPVQIVSA